VAVHVVRWDKGSMLRAGIHNYFYGKERENNQLGKVFLHTTEKHQQLRE